MNHVLRWVGLGAFALSSVLYLGAPLVAPPLGVGLLWVGWAVMAVVSPRLWRTRWGMVALPLASVGFWVAVLLVGEAVFGWTA